MKTQRDAFFDRLYELACADRNIIIVSGDQAAPSLDKWRANLPDQWIPAQVAEQNAIALAAGLALSGKKVFVYALAHFITMRCYEQIAIDLCAMNLPVTIIGVGAGLSYDDAGPTHHCITDISALRCLPNLTIHNITDNVMAAAFARISLEWLGPNYVRLDREALPDVYPSDWHDWSGASGAGVGLTFVATGNMVHRAREVCSGIPDPVGLINVYAFPIPRVFLDRLWEADRIVTLEEHVLPGGLGSAVLEVLAEAGLSIPVKCLGLPREYCYEYGGRERLHRLYGLDKESIIKEIERWT